MSDDPLSDVLDLVGAHCVLSGALVAGSAWARRFPVPQMMKFLAVAEGRCWLLMEGLDTPLHLEIGDVVLVNVKRGFVLTSDPALSPERATATLGRDEGDAASLGEGRDFLLVGGHVELDPARQGLLLDALPPLIHVRGATPEAAAARWLLDQLVREGEEAQPGAALATTQLAQLLFLQVLRAFLAGSAGAAAGWLRALGDERIAPALRLMHADPARPWTLGELARATGMSRTSFALRFKAVVGVAPLAYLLGWRMQLAERDLRDSDRPVSAIAFELGYASESAFSNAFKRTRNMAPRRYRVAFGGLERPAAPPLV